VSPEEIRATLEGKLAEIDAEMAEMEKPPTDQGTISFGKRIGEGTSMAIDRMAQVAVHDRLQLTRADVVRALAKLDEGSYGSCDVCGRPIGEGRLEALPWAVLCVDDAGKR
jgi:DnaK suppressor protein